jgi:hypothetical protein
MRAVETVDVAWLLLCAVLVLFMQAGFTALESGLVRSKNSVNVAIAATPPRRRKHNPTVWAAATPVRYELAGWPRRVSRAR